MPDYLGGKVHHQPKPKRVKPRKPVKVQKPRLKRRFPDDFMDPLNPRTARKERQAQLNLKYGPEEREIASEQRISGQQRANVGGYYDDYLKALHAATGAVTGAYGAAQGNVYAQANTARTQDEAARKQMLEDANKSAALRGTSAGPDLEGGKAAMARNALSNSFGGYIGALGAGATNLSVAREVSGAGSKLRALEDEDRRSRELSTRSREVASERGQSAVELRRQQREDERRYGLERSAFGLDVAKARSDVRSDRAKTKLDRQKARLDALDKKADNRRLNASERRQRADLREKMRHNRETEKNARDKGGSGGKKGSSLTDTQLRSVRAKAREAANDGRTASWITNQLVIHEGLSKGQARRIAHRAVKQYGSSPTAKRKQTKRAGKKAKGVFELLG